MAALVLKEVDTVSCRVSGVHKLQEIQRMTDEGVVDIDVIVYAG